MKRYSEALERWEQEAYHDGYGENWLADIGEGVKYYAMECEAKGRRPTFAGTKEIRTRSLLSVGHISRP